MNIVQIGTNKAYDDVTDIVNQYSEHINKLILVEPLKVHHQSIKECYKNYPQHVIEPSVIVDNNDQKEIIFYYHKDDGPGFEVSSTNKEHILKHVVFNPKLTSEGIIEQSTPCLTTSELFDKYDLKDINILYIDAEGYDDKIIYNLNLHKYNITNIIYEHLHIDSEAVIKYLENMGYTTIRNYGHNGWSHAVVKN